jgi:hypothetical protein
MNAGTLESARLRHPAGSRLGAADGRAGGTPVERRPRLVVVPRPAAAGRVPAVSGGPDPRRRPAVCDPISPSLRLTRRGRGTLLVLILALVFCGGLVFGSKASGADARPAAPATTLRTVVVQPGQSLWTIARDADPKGDPRAMIDRIIAINALRGAGIAAGHRLLVP